jgi:adenosylmethionine-8-amino-7-oxononanoate aminotransferase
MPPFVITKEELTHLTSAIFTVVKEYESYKENTA